MFVREKNMIPKVIHYCWFGRNTLPQYAKNCIESWKRYCPDYEIKEWNESNFPMDCCTYVQEAYKAKKWAFVSDYARFWILYREGGVYFDTDVELMKSIDDLIVKGPFMGCETALSDEGLPISGKVAPGLGIAAYPGISLYKTILDSYIDDCFICSDGTENKKTIVMRTTEILEKYGFDWHDRSIQEIEGICIYPSDFFCPICYATGEIKITENTRSVHHYAETWKTTEELQMKRIMQWIDKRFGRRLGEKLSPIVVIPLRVKKSIKGYGIIGTAKIIIYKIKNYVKR